MMIRKGWMLVFVVAILVSCKKKDDPCDSAIPTCSCAYIGIVDSDGNSLLGPANVYKPAEISLSFEGQVIELIEDDLGGEDLYLKFFLIDMVSDADYLLQLNDTETDIVNLEIDVNQGGCFITYAIEKFSLNGTEIPALGEIYLIEK